MTGWGEAEIAAAHREALRRGHLPMFTIYDRPADAPDSVVVRLSWTGEAEPVPGPAWAFDSIDEARAAIGSLWLYRVPRDPHDPPSVVETWL